MNRRPYSPLGIGFLFIALCSPLLAQMAPEAHDPGQPASPATGAAARTQNASPRSLDDFIIGNSDVLDINVWKEPDLTRTIPVRSDGKISLPLVGEIEATGRTPLQLQAEITSRLRNYITEPEVTVMVQQINSEKYNVVGQVLKPGSYSVTVATTVMDALANAGGFKDFAKKKSVHILRENPNGTESRYTFNYEAFVKGKNPQQNIQLQPGDTVIVN